MVFLDGIGGKGGSPPEGDHDGYAPLTRAAIPVTWGHAMEVPERMLKCLSSLAGDHAASMFNPGAAISGYRMHKISGVNEFGPLEEKAATLGASLEPKIVFAGSSAAASTDKPMKSHE
uniref:Uncharacterized protein n=1 Tax=Oryza nivara TaxID=4536 RepID=A0A0E0HTP2_ORYNI